MSTDDPRPPTEQLLSQTLTATALATPTTDRSDDLRRALERADGRKDEGAADLGRDEGPAAAPPDGTVDLGENPVIDVLRGPRASPRRRGLILASAAALIVALAAVAVLVDRGSDREGEVVAAPPATAPATGWFLPDGGWDVVSVETDYLDTGEAGACPCTLWAAARPGTDPAAINLAESGASKDAGLPGMPTEPIDVGGRPGTVSQGAATFLTVPSSDQHLRLQARGVDVEALVAVADAWLDQREAGVEIDPAELGLPAGFVATAPQEKSWDFEHLLAVRIREDDTGREVEYQLVPTGWNRGVLTSASELTVEEGVFRVAGGTGDEAYLATVGGPTDVLLGPPFFGSATDELAPAELQELFDGLHEVPTADWRAALEQTDENVDPDVRAAPDLFSAPLTGP
ncbi:MAG: hypothetical protein ACR2JF_02240 [Iamia sp.]